MYYCRRQWRLPVPVVRSFMVIWKMQTLRNQKQVSRESMSKARNPNVGNPVRNPHVGNPGSPLAENKCAAKKTALFCSPPSTVVPYLRAAAVVRTSSSLCVGSLCVPYVGSICPRQPLQHSSVSAENRPTPNPWRSLISLHSRCSLRPCELLQQQSLHFWKNF